MKIIRFLLFLPIAAVWLVVWTVFSVLRWAFGRK